MNSPEAKSRAGPAPTLRTRSRHLPCASSWNPGQRWSKDLVSAIHVSGAALVPALLSMAAIVGVELPSSCRLPWRWKRTSAWQACSGPVLPRF